VNLLLDTNVLSEVKRPIPDASVLAYLDSLDEDRVFLSIASIAELRHGVALMRDGRRREALAAWLAHELPQRFADRILPIDQAIAIRWGDLMAVSRRKGIAFSVMDGFFAATALAHNLTLVTCNTKDFVPFGVKLFNPWDQRSHETFV
jgi:predicted nucleic acid-binding protein